jgi:transcriptional regulator GlxA family with amidase domain
LFVRRTNFVVAKVQMKTAQIENPKPTVQSTPGCRVESCESEVVRKIEQSISHMLRHLDEPLQVATLAAQANISPSHFFALFKRQIGCAPIDYFIRLRMQHACHLLDETILSVKEIAAKLGYDDPFYFSRIFKSVNHVAPSEYRALQKQPSPVLRSRAAAESGQGANGNGAAPVSLPGNGRNQKVGSSIP